MKRIFPVLLALTMVLCVSPAAFAASTEHDKLTQDFADAMDTMDEMDIPTADEIKDMLKDLLNVDGLAQASSALLVFLSNEYIRRSFVTSFLLALIAYVIFGKR